VPVFVDTTVLVYARDASEPEKQPQAAAWVEHLWRTRTARLSFQVLQEYYATTTRKLRPGLPPEQARADVRDLVAWRPVPVGTQLLEAGWTVEDRFGLSCWDALIVAAARIAGCEYLLTEDLQHGAEFEGLQVVDPFRAAAGTLG
jgi:predicted nucleic acid-binding protein